MNAPHNLEMLSLPRVITINLPAREQIEGRATDMLESAQAIVIDSASMHEIAADELRTIKGELTRLEEIRKTHVGPLNDEVKYINDHFRAPRTMLEAGETAIKGKMIAYQGEQEKLRLAEQRRLEELARLERIRIAAENAEKERAAFREAEKKLEEQAQALAEEKAARAQAAKRQKEIEAAIKAGNEDKAKEAARLHAQAEANRIAQREAADQAGREATAMLTAAAEQVSANEAAQMVMTAPVVLQAVKVAGIATKGTFKGECVDLLALIRFIAVNPQYVHLVKANETAINQTAKAQREATKIDGIRVWEEKTIAARRA
jgi:hypothetical protein